MEGNLDDAFAGAAQAALSQVATYAAQSVINWAFGTALGGPIGFVASQFISEAIAGLFRDDGRFQYHVKTFLNGVDVSTVQYWWKDAPGHVVETVQKMAQTHNALVEDVLKEFGGTVSVADGNELSGFGWNTDQGLLTGLRGAGGQEVRGNNALDLVELAVVHDLKRLTFSGVDPMDARAFERWKASDWSKPKGCPGWPVA